MKLGTFYGLGVGPGDPELLTLKALRVLERCPHVFVPKARKKAESVALDIARSHIPGDAVVHRALFPMTEDREELVRRWDQTACEVAELLRSGQDVCFLTLGDTLLYSTHIYLLRALQEQLPDVNVVTVPGITAMSAVAALTQFPLGEGKKPVTIVPSADDMSTLDRAIDLGGTLVIMKVGKRLGAVLDLLESRGVIDGGVFVSRAGLDGERLERDLKDLKSADPKAGYLSTILVDCSEGVHR